MNFRVGTGLDIHELISGSMIKLAGVSIPSKKMIKAHSDGDIIYHALADAILGALAEGDIGQIFPPSEEAWRNADSSIFLKKSIELMKKKKFRISNADITIICEEPKIGPYSTKMRNNISKICELSPDQISVKATTSERLGFTGRGEGIMSIATVLLETK